MKKVALGILVSLSFLICFCAALFAQEGSVLFSGSAPKDDISRIIVCSKAFEALGDIGDPRAKPTLQKGLRSKDYLLRVAAASALGDLGDREVISQLKDLLGDENYLVKMAAAKSLVRLSEPGMEEVLLNFLSNGDPAVRVACVNHLSRFGDRYAPQVFKALTREKNPAVRQELINFLGDVKYGVAAEYITQFLSDENPQVRQAACRTMAIIGEKGRAVSLLQGMLKDSHKSVHGETMISLSKLGENSILSACWRDVLSDDYSIRGSAFEALANLKDVNVLPVLLKAIMTTDNPTYVKMSAAKSLKILKPTVSQMVASSLDKAKGGTQDVIEAMYKIEGKSLLVVLTKSLVDPKSPLYADAPSILRELREDITLPALREALFQDNADVAANIAYTLGQFRDRSSVEPLIRLCRDYGF